MTGLHCTDGIHGTCPDLPRAVDIPPGGAYVECPACGPIEPLMVTLVDPIAGVPWHAELKPMAPEDPPGTVPDAWADKITPAVRALYETGASFREIAYRYEVPRSWVRRRLIDVGVQLRPDGGQPGPRVVDGSADCTCEGTATLYARGHRCMRTRAAHAAQMRAHRAAIQAGAVS